MNFYVTQKDIDEGLTHTPGFCPIALAVKRRIKNERVSVGPNAIFIERNSVRLPYLVYEFIYQFDNERPVKPFRFQLEINK